MARDTQNNRAALWVALLLFVAGAITLWAMRNGATDAKHAGTAGASASQLVISTKAGDRTFAIEVATTPDQQATGLMFRTSLPETSGMLFAHTPPREVTMWMRNTYIPLDMVFIRSDGVIHRIEAKTEPLSEKVIASNGQVAAVLEIGGGVAAKLGIEAGDKVRHSFFEPSK